MNTCLTCKHWKRDGETCRSAFDGDEDEETVDLDGWNRVGKSYAFEIGICDQPKLLKFIRPESADGLAVLDGSTYMARLLTAQDFGCVNHTAR